MQVPENIWIISLRKRGEQRKANKSLKVNIYTEEMKTRTCLMQLARDGTWALALFSGCLGDLNVQVELRDTVLNRTNFSNRS